MTDADDALEIAEHSAAQLHEIADALDGFKCDTHQCEVEDLPRLAGRLRQIAADLA